MVAWYRHHGAGWQAPYVTTPLRLAVVAEARTYMGTRWQHQGRMKHIGVDCIGLIGMSALACGVSGARQWRDDPNFHNYGPSPSEKLIYKGCDAFMDRIPIKEAYIGDVYIMSFGPDAQHFALISRPGDYVIHAYSSSPRRVTENGIKIWKGGIMRAYRFREPQ